jgi:hypothetical protein
VTLPPDPVPERDIEPVVEAIVEPSIFRALPATGPAEIEIEPKVDSTVLEVNVTFPDPERVRLSLAEKFPVGFIDVPPLTVKVPAELRAPEPVYAPLGSIETFPEGIKIFPEGVVVIAALTVIALPTTVVLPAAFTDPETVVSPAILLISTSPREVIGAPLVMLPELVNLTAPAFMAPVPVLTVERALEITTSWPAVIVALVLVKSFPAPVDAKVTLPVSEVTLKLWVMVPPR